MVGKKGQVYDDCATNDRLVVVSSSTALAVVVAARCGRLWRSVFLYEILLGARSTSVHSMETLN